MIEVAGYQVMFLEWTLVIVTFILTCLRVYARLHLKSTIYTWNDLFALLAWASFLLAAALDTCLYKAGYFENIPLSPKLLKILYVEGGNYFWCLYAAKASMLCFYTQLVPRTMKKTRILMWTTAALTIIGFITTECILFFWCQPISSHWEIDPEKQCSAAWSAQAYIVSYVFHLLTDILVYSIPIIVVRAVKLPSNQKVAVAFTFALGFLCIVWAVSVIAASWTVPNLGFGWVFGCLELSWGVVIVCAPSFKYFISKWDSESVRGTIRKVGGSWVLSATQRSRSGQRGGSASKSNKSWSGGHRDSRVRTNISTTDRFVQLGSNITEEEVRQDKTQDGVIVINRTVEIELEDRQRDLERGEGNAERRRI